MPSRSVASWRLTEEGHRFIRTHAQYPSNNLGHDEQYPARPAPLRKGRLEHDSLVAETVLCLVAARTQGQALSGVFPRLEIKLNPFHSAPWADALVVCHTSLDQMSPHPIPWTRNLPTGGEEDAAFIVELDRATEPLATIGGKAREYRAMFEDERWKRYSKERFGDLPPRLLWVVPTAQRGSQVQQAWQENWPGGRWYIATFEQMRNNAWQRSLAGERRTVHFFKSVAQTPAVAVAPVDPTQAAAPSVQASPAAQANPTPATGYAELAETQVRAALEANR